MQFAHNIWQLFNSGVIRTLSSVCRKVSQGMWGRKLCEALHDYSGLLCPKRPSALISGTLTNRSGFVKILVS